MPALPPSPFLHQFGGLSPVQAGGDLWQTGERHGIARAGRASGRTDGEGLCEHLHDPVSCPARSLLRAALSALELVTNHANHV